MNENQNGNGTEEVKKSRGRKPAEYSFPQFKADIQKWLKSGKNKEVLSRYTIQPEVRDSKGITIDTFEVIQSPEFNRIPSDSPSRVEVVRLQTDGTYQYKPELVVVSTFEYRNGKFVKVKTEETPAE
jgi:hypothetical protein